MRWKLATAHYLKVPGIEWEYMEQGMGKKGRTLRKKFLVPLFLDPRDSGDWTETWGLSDNPEGHIVVCYEGKGEPKDIVFEGDPTPDMIPLDDEAKALSAQYEKRWQYKVDGDMPGSYSQSLVDHFQEEMAFVQAKPVEVAGLSELVQAMAVMAQQNQAILQTIAAQAPKRL